MRSSKACGRYCPLGCRPVRRDRPAAVVETDLSSRKPDYGTRNRRQEPLAEAGTRTYETLAACPVGVPRVSQISEWHAYRPRLSAYQSLRSRAYEGHGAWFRSPGEVRRSSQTCILRSRARPTSAIAALPGCENSIGAVDLPDSGSRNVVAAVITRRPQMMIDTANLQERLAPCRGAPECSSLAPLARFCPTFANRHCSDLLTRRGLRMRLKGPATFDEEVPEGSGRTESVGARS